MMLWLTLCAGFGVGVVSGLIGIGGGVMLVPLFIYAYKMDIYTAVGTSLAVITPVALMGAVSHSLKGHVNFGPVVLVALAAMVGVFVSGQMAHFIPAVWLRRGFACFLMVVAVKMLLK